MSLDDEVTRYYAERAPVYDDTAGYRNPESEALRGPTKYRYRKAFAGHDVLEIACGTGYWTAVLGEVARSVLAVDINPSVLSRAEVRCKHLANVKFQIADAYTLEGVPNGFTAAFARWWWSHIPLERLEGFLTALHGKLALGACVLFADQLRYVGPSRRHDEAGNCIEQRFLADGRSFEIVKNFPTEKDIRNALSDIADNVRYVEYPEEGNWNVSFATRK